MEAYPRAAGDESTGRDVAGDGEVDHMVAGGGDSGISDRHMRRWRKRYVEEGYNGLLDRRRGKPRRRVPLATVEKVFGLYREKYFDLNVQHFHEKLQAEHGIELSYTWVKQALQGAGLVARGRKRGAHRKRRERRPLPGMLLHIDGSRHQWFQDERWYDLIVILDDASSEIYYAQLVEEESTATVMAGPSLAPIFLAAFVAPSELPPSPATPSPKSTQPKRRGHNFETGHFTCYKKRTF